MMETIWKAIAKGALFTVLAMAALLYFSSAAGATDDSSSGDTEPPVTTIDYGDDHGPSEEETPPTTPEPVCVIADALDAGWTPDGDIPCAHVNAPTPTTVVEVEIGDPVVETTTTVPEQDIGDPATVTQPPPLPPVLAATGVSWYALGLGLIGIGFGIFGTAMVLAGKDR